MNNFTNANLIIIVIIIILIIMILWFIKKSKIYKEKFNNNTKIEKIKENLSELLEREPLSFQDANKMTYDLKNSGNVTKNDSKSMVNMVIGDEKNTKVLNEVTADNKLITDTTNYTSNSNESYNNLYF